MIELRIEGTEIREGRCKQLPDDLKETRGHWKFREEEVHRIPFYSLLWKKLWTCKADFGVNEWINELMNE